MKLDPITKLNSLEKVTLADMNEVAAYMATTSGMYDDDFHCAVLKAIAEHRCEDPVACAYVAYYA